MHLIPGIFRTIKTFFCCPFQNVRRRKSKERKETWSALWGWRVEPYTQQKSTGGRISSKPVNLPLFSSPFIPLPHAFCIYALANKRAQNWDYRKWFPHYSFDYTHLLHPQPRLEVEIKKLKKLTNVRIRRGISSNIWHARQLITIRNFNFYFY